MKRDLDLVRAVLLAAEAHDSPLATRLTIPGWSQEQIDYHCQLLDDAGLIQLCGGEAVVRTRQETIVTATSIRLTWEAHEFLAAARDVKIWQLAKARVEQAGVFTFDVLRAVLTELVKQQLGV